jgi:phospholipase/lecithinase/hemolysin
MLPRQDAHEVDRTTYNTCITTNAAGKYTVVDFAANATMGAAGAEDNTTYYNVDKIHPTNAGHQILANIAQAAMYP